MLTSPNKKLRPRNSKLSCTQSWVRCKEEKEACQVVCQEACLEVCLEDSQEVCQEVKVHKEDKDLISRKSMTDKM